MRYYKIPTVRANLILHKMHAVIDKQNMAGTPYSHSPILQALLVQFKEDSVKSRRGGARSGGWCPGSDGKPLLAKLHEITGKWKGRRRIKVPVCNTAAADLQKRRAGSSFSGLTAVPSCAPPSEGGRPGRLLPPQLIAGHSRPKNQLKPRSQWSIPTTWMGKLGFTALSV